MECDDDDDDDDDEVLYSASIHVETCSKSKMKVFFNFVYRLVVIFL